MQLTETLEKEILKNYDRWLDSYLNGDVATYDSYFDDAYHFIGSTNNEEFLSRKDTTNFFRKTAEQFAGKTDSRNEIKTVELFDNLVFITHAFDAWFLKGKDWVYYGRFRFSSVMQKKNKDWKFIYQHFSTTDSKADHGDTIGFDKVNLENQELREAIKRRTFELEEKNRALEIEGALERIRAQAVAMKQSSDLLEIVVSMRNEFTKLGHEAHYFWHMMWLPETYEKAMTSGDGSKIGFVMELPRQIHGDIPQLAKWEKSKKPTVVHAMNVDDALDYVHKMVTLGDFQNIDPQAPTEDDIKHIGGLTFIMARTTHGEIGYSLPGVVKNPPKEDIDILVKFAGAFDLAHQRFLDLQKAEKQARETQIELSLERIRSRVTAMQESTELFDVVVAMRNEFLSLGHEADYFWHMKWAKDNYEMSMTAEDGGRLGMVITVPRFVHEQMEDLHQWEKSNSPYFVLALNGKDAWDYIDKMNTYGKYKLVDPHAPSEEDILHIGGLTFIIARTTHGEIGFSLAGKIDNPPQVSIEILVRFASVFDLAYKRFEDLKKAEAQTRETQIELALEKVRSRTMAMQHSDELSDAAEILYKEFYKLGVTPFSCGYLINNDTEKQWNVWMTDANNESFKSFWTLPYNADQHIKDRYENWQKNKPFHSTELKDDANIEHHKIIAKYAPWKNASLKDLPESLVLSSANFKYGHLLIVTGEALSERIQSILIRFAKVFEQTYTRFLDLRKAEAQTRETQIELALEKVRSRTMAMQHSDELQEASFLLDQQVRELGIKTWGCAFNIYGKKESTEWFGNEAGVLHTYTVPREGIFKDYYDKGQKGETLVIQEFSGDDCVAHYEYMSSLPVIGDVLKTLKETNHGFPTYQIDHVVYFKYGYLLFITREYVPDSHAIFKRFAKVFEQTYTRFLDLQKAEAQTREAQIEAALERVRSRSIGMQQSKELAKVVLLLDEELIGLGIEVHGTQIITDFDNAEKKVTVWFGKKGQDFLERIHVPYFDHPIRKEFHNAWKKGLDIHTGQYSKTDKNKFFRLLFKNSDFSKITEERQKFIYDSPGLTRTSVLFKNSILIFQRYNLSEFSEEEVAIFKRFSKVFEQAYTRFLDLQKAEAQAREAKIEAALEKVRSRTMAMQKGEEVKDVVVLLYKELIALGVTNFATCGYVEINEETQLQSTWVTNPGGDSLGLFYLPLTGDIYFDERYEAWKNQQTVLHQTVAGKVRRKHLEYAITTFNSKEAEEMVLTQFPDPTVFYCFNFSHGYLHLVSGSYLTKDEEALLARFTKVFEQTYARFLDLEKAEAQTRKAQIEASLERVRAKAMAMHDSNELDEVLSVLCEQFDVLGIVPMSTHMTVLDFQNNTFTFRETGKFGNRSFGEQSVALDAMDNWKETVDKWRADKATAINKLHFPKEQLAEVWEVFHESFASMPEGSRIKPQDYPDGIYHTAGKHPFGYIGMNQTRPATEEEEQIVIKFANEFGMAYQRFLDLQKAEAQARESQIEAALEKVRSRSLAMHTTDELQEVVALVTEKLRDLGVIFDAGGVILCTYFPDNKDVMHWIAAEDFSYSGNYLVPYFDTTIFKDTWESKNRGDVYFSKEFSVKDKNSFFEYAFEHSDYKHFPDAFKQHALEAKNHRITAAWSKNSAILIPSFGIDEPSKSDAEILKRFAKVFEQTYIRFMDLQKAEERARETQIDIALERVRSRTMGMQKSDELAETSSVLFQQIKELASETWSCGFCIWQDNDEVELWMGADSGGLLPPMLIPYKKEPTHREIYEASLRNELEYNKVWNGKALKEHYAFLRTIPSVAKAIKVMEDSGLRLPKQQCYYVGFFKHGYLLLITEEPNDNLVDLSQRFTKVFDLTYTRFLDLQLKEKQAVEILNEKQRLEKTLSDLKQTQKQLIQSEKMASLGELTAGIAHEIQNPLNFVNNFSEVSKELLDEMLEEMENGDLEEVKAIMDDVIQNLEKINHHGKRADGIVKGMLQHSRASGNKKEPTNINALADEYLRLAYHGLRAKDKSFNAQLVTDFDKDITTVNVIPQDLGRVILNLLTNAFYVVNEKNKTGLKNYEPTVSISTKKKKNNLEIKVSDNGNGMPNSVKDKIFQPFFTTKPTGQGTGLGLSMSYDIITKGHDGELEVDTKKGKGTTFKIIIPLTPTNQ